MRFFIAVILILALFSISSWSLSGQQSKILKSSGIIICSSVSGCGKYKPMLIHKIYPGQKIYIYNDVEVLGRRVDGKYEIWLTWRIFIYNPLGYLDYTSSISTNRRKYDVKIIKYAGWFTWTASKSKIEGKYTIILEVINNLSNEKLTYMSYFYLSDSLTKIFRVNINYSLTFENMGNRPSTITKLYVSIIRDWKPFQKVVLGPIFNINPNSIESDEYGNKYAVYRDILLNPGEGKTISIQYILKINISYFKHRYISLNSLKNLPESFRRFLAPEKYIESNSSEIILKAFQIKDGLDDVYLICKGIANFTSTYIKYVKVPENKGALWTYRNKIGDCTQFSRLYVALARAIGIPAYTVSGYSLSNIDFDRIFESNIGHTWVAIYLPNYGWIPLEPQSSGDRFGLTPYPYIVFVHRGGSETSIDDVKISVGRFYYYYVGPKPRVKESLKYMISRISGFKENVTINANIPDKIYAGEWLNIYGNINPPIDNGIVYVVVNKSNNIVFNNFFNVSNGIFSGEISIPPKKYLLGTLSITIIWPGDEKYNEKYFKKNINVVERDSSISIFLSKNEATIGDRVIVYGRLSPPLNNESIIIILRSPRGKEYRYTVKTFDGNYSFIFDTGRRRAGKWLIIVMWSGGERDYVYKSCRNQINLKLKENILIENLLFLAITIMVAAIVISILIILLYRRRRERYEEIYLSPIS